MTASQSVQHGEKSTSARKANTRGTYQHQSTGQRTGSLLCMQPEHPFVEIKNDKEYCTSQAAENSPTTLFRYPYNLFLMERLEFLLLTQDELEARILRVLEYEILKHKEKWQSRVRTAIEAKKPISLEPKEYWVRLSYSQIIAKLYRFDTSRVGGAKQALSISKTSLRRAINGLLTKNLILMRSVRGDEYGAPQYTLNRKTIQEALDTFPTELDPYSIFYRTPLSDEEDGEVPIWKVGKFQFGKGVFDNWQEGGSNLERGEVPNRKVFKESEKESTKECGKREVEETVTSTESLPSEPTAPAAQDILQSLSEEEIALILSLRQQQQATGEENTHPIAPLEPEMAPQASEQASRMPFATEPELTATLHTEPPDSAPNASQSACPPAQELARPASHVPLTDVIIIQLWEYLRKAPYTKVERKSQLAAAQELLRLAPTLALPLTVDLLEQVYTKFRDDFWIEKFHGILNVSHLIQTEKSSGQVRIARWLSMLQAQGQGSGQTQIAITGTTGGMANGITYADFVGMADEARAALVEEQRERHAQKYAELGISREALMAMEPEDRIAFIKRHREQQGILAAALSAGAA